tara:strand:+ start:386 stop:808 length:423 start_codon:yes stop_codon:yes gene_type:complete
MIDVDYLDTLAADQMAAGFNLTGADIKSAANAIRELQLTVKNLQEISEGHRISEQVMATSPERILFDSFEAYLTAKIREEIENFDFSFVFDPDSVRNIVQQMSADGEIEAAADSDQVEEVVRDMIRNGSINIQADIELEC